MGPLPRDLRGHLPRGMRVPVVGAGHWMPQGQRLQPAWLPGRPSLLLRLSRGHGDLLVGADASSTVTEPRTTAGVKKNNAQDGIDLGEMCHLGHCKTEQERLPFP